MSNLQIRRLLSLLLIMSLSSGLFLLVAGPVKADQSVTDTPGTSGTPASGNTPATTDTPVPASSAAPSDTPGTVETTTTSATPEATSALQNDVWSAPVNLSQS